MKKILQVLFICSAAILPIPLAAMDRAAAKRKETLENIKRWLINAIEYKIDGDIAPLLKTLDGMSETGDTRTVIDMNALLRLAAYRHSEYALEVLLARKDIDINTRDNAGEDLLQLAMSPSSPNEREAAAVFAIAKLLLSRGITCRDEALFTAVDKHYQSIVQLLNEKDPWSESRYTALERAVSGLNEEAVDFFLDKYTSICRNYCGEKMLYTAADNGLDFADRRTDMAQSYVRIIDKLLKAGAQSTDKTSILINRLKALCKK